MFNHVCGPLREEVDYGGEEENRQSCWQNLAVLVVCLNCSEQFTSVMKQVSVAGGVSAQIAGDVMQ